MSVTKLAEFYEMRKADFGEASKVITCCAECPHKALTGVNSNFPNESFCTLKRLIILNEQYMAMYCPLPGLDDVERLMYEAGYLK